MSQPVAQVGKKGEIERFAIASFVAALGQLAWFLAYFVPTLAITIAPLGPSLAVIFGLVGRRRINRSGGRLRGRALARIGMVLGFLELVFYLLALLLLHFTLHSGHLFCDGQCLP